jgi:hypothetical protein
MAVKFKKKFFRTVDVDLVNDSCYVVNNRPVVPQVPLGFFCCSKYDTVAP